MGNTVVIAPTTRNEGHGKFVLEVDDGGIVKKGYFMSLVTVRGFEKFLLGKAMEFGPIATSRFCGLCPPTHATASSEAIERSIGLTPPPTGLQLRELCNIGNHLHDHPLQQILILPDFVRDEAKIREDILLIQKMRRIGQYICDVVGGEAIHSPYIRIGGMLCNISDPARKKLLEQMTVYKKYAAQHRAFMEAAFESVDVPARLGRHDEQMMATDLIYGRSDVFEKEYYPRYSEVLPVNYYGQEVGAEASTVIPMIDNKIIEVGPLARLRKFKGYKEKGTMALNRARLDEIDIRTDRAVELLKGLDTRANTLNRPSSGGDGKLGIGVNEAPRGTNVHMARVKDSRIIEYKAMPATMWSIPVIGKATEGFHYKWAQWVMRSYDPCISCATHMIVMNDGKVIEEKMLKPSEIYLPLEAWR